MGCGGSKPTATESSNQPATARPTTSQRPRTRSQHPPTSSRRPDTANRRSETANRRRPSSRGEGSSSHGPRSQAGRQTRGQTRERHRSRPHTILEEPEDAAIEQEVSNLANLIDQHSLNFYIQSSANWVCQTIGQKIVQELKEATDDGF